MNPWLSDDDPEQLRATAQAVVNAWEAFYPRGAAAHGNADDFTRLRAAMRDLWKTLR